MQIFPSDIFAYFSDINKINDSTSDQKHSVFTSSSHGSQPRKRNTPFTFLALTRPQSSLFLTEMQAGKGGKAFLFPLTSLRFFISVVSVARLIRPWVKKLQRTKTNSSLQIRERGKVERTFLFQLPSHCSLCRGRR